MIRCCCFGTIRLDIHVYREYADLKDYDEIKVSDMAIRTGGSVYNTANVLGTLGVVAPFYTLNASDSMAEYAWLMRKRPDIPFLRSEEDHNSTAASIIFVDGDGRKKMVSYDGRRQDAGVLARLQQDIAQYDLFYTSFYEINAENIATMEGILSACRINFIDLSPLIYEVGGDIVRRVLEKVQILSGTEEEYAILTEQLGLGSFEELLTLGRLEYVLVKRGRRGASLYHQGRSLDYRPRAAVASRDTTGCGDTFNAAVIDGLVRGLPDEELLQNAVELATRVARDGLDSLGV